MAPVTRRSLLAAVPLTAPTAPPATAVTRPGATGAGAARTVGALTATGGARDGARTGEVRDALARGSRPSRTTDPRGGLDDLRPPGAAVGRVPVVGLGEVAHGARELYRLEHRVFRCLAEEKGFTTFALETGWAAGLRIDAYVRHGDAAGFRP